MPRSGSWGGGSWGGPRCPGAGWLAGKGHTIPRPDQLTPTFLLLPFSSEATGFFPPNEGDGEGRFGGLHLGKDPRRPPGELAWWAGCREPVFRTLGASVSSGSLCLSHARLTDSLTHPSFILPSSPPEGQSPSVSCYSGSHAQIWLLHWESLVHSYVHNSPSLLPQHGCMHTCPHTHTHTLLGDTVSCTLPGSHTLTIPVTTLTCTPAHPHPESYSSPFLAPSSRLAAKHRVPLWMPSLLMTPPPSIPTAAPHLETAGAISHLCVSTNTRTLSRRGV